MDNNIFILKNSIFLTIYCFIIMNLSNIVQLKFDYSNNIQSYITLGFISMMIFLGFIIMFFYYDDADGGAVSKIIRSYDKMIEMLQGSDNFQETVITDGYEKYIFAILIILVPIVSFIMGMVSLNKRVEKDKKKIKFTKNQLFVLLMSMICLLFLFFQIIFISIVNNITKTQTNSNLKLYLNTYFLLFLIYCGLYSFYIHREIKAQTKKNNTSV